MSAGEVSSAPARPSHYRYRLHSCLLALEIAAVRRLKAALGHLHTTWVKSQTSDRIQETARGALLPRLLQSQKRIHPLFSHAPGKMLRCGRNLLFQVNGDGFRPEPDQNTDVILRIWQPNNDQGWNSSAESLYQRSVLLVSRRNSSQRSRVPLFLFPILAALVVPVTLGQTPSPIRPGDLEQSRDGKQPGENKSPDNATAPKASKASSNDSPKIQDNSFLVEEAYNQEFGVVQHIQSVQRLWDSKGWVYTFTQEWPVDASPRHQLSYTLTALHSGQQPASGAGFGDVILNYRYQLLGNGESKVAFAPRLSLLLPTGDYRLGRGAGGAGIQSSLPLSVVLTENW